MSKCNDNVFLEDMEDENTFNQLVDTDTDDIDIVLGDSEDPQDGILFSREIPDEELLDDEDDYL